MPFICFIITLDIAITKWQFDSSLIRLLAAELCDAFFNSGIYRCFNCPDGFLVGLRDKYGNTVFLSTTIDGYGFSTVEIAETRVNTGYYLGFAVVLICHIIHPP